MKKSSFIYSMILILIGIVTLILPLFNISNVKAVLIGIMLVYATIYMLKYLSNKGLKKMLLALGSLINAGIIYLLDFQKNPRAILFVFLFWVVILAFAKLFQTDMYHDKNDKKWIISLSGFVASIILGLISCISLHYGNNTQILVLGFYFFFIGFLDLVDSLLSNFDKK